MPVITYECHACRNSFDLDVKIGRLDTCPHCAADLHCCKNCTFFDESGNRCLENVTNYVPTRDRANSCQAFVFISGDRGPKADIDSAKARLEALFKKK